MSSPRRIESYLLDGAAGKLEALLEEPESRPPREACLVCHPHPLYGGTMHNKVVYRIARALRRSGSVVLRFNFRGVPLDMVLNYLSDAAGFVCTGYAGPRRRAR